jgi:hypothetical protein
LVFTECPSIIVLHPKSLGRRAPKLGRVFKVLLIALKERKSPLVSPLKRGTLRRFFPFLRLFYFKIK